MIRSSYLSHGSLEEEAFLYKILVGLPTSFWTVSNPSHGDLATISEILQCKF